MPTGPGEQVPERTGHGHGTHCTGTACGPAEPPSGRRYGVASEAEIFAGKVLGDRGSGSDAGILAGIDWAITNGCQVIAVARRRRAAGLGGLRDGRTDVQ